MKKATFAKFAALAAAAALSQGASASDGTINFTGEIVDAPCSVNANSQNMIVPLGKVSRTLLNGAPGKKAVPANFVLSLTCGESAKGATVTFTGVTDADVKDDLKVGVGEVVETVAKGVAVELGDSAGVKIPVGAESREYALAAGDNALKFQAVYVSTLPAVTVGKANAATQFTINYK